MTLGACTGLEQHTRWLVSDMRTNFGEVTPGQKLALRRERERVERSFMENSFICRILKQQEEGTMKQYIGTKIVNMKPMTRGEYNIFRGWDLPAKGEDEGFLVEYLDGGAPNTPHFSGYVSWSPKEQAENAYRLTDGMSFGLAIEALKKGLKVAREGWNGKGLWLELQVPDANSKMTLPYIFICYPSDAKNTPGARVPWLASQTDMLADDWRMV